MYEKTAGGPASGSRPSARKTRSRGESAASVESGRARASPVQAEPTLPAFLQRHDAGSLAREQPGDLQEREADVLAAAAVGSGARSVQEIASLAGLEARSVRLHVGSEAAASADAVRARAYTVGSDIVFGAAQFAPHTPRGAHLLAHEMAHVAQQRRTGQPKLQRQSADVTLPEASITGALNPISSGVKDLDALTSEREADETETAGVDPDAPDSTERLPFSGSGWEAGTILTRLGQYDDMVGTDSDANRCVQAVALSSYIVQGPDAVKQYINALLLDAATTRPRGARENKAREVLDYFRARLDNREATYGDVSWAQEAMHDLYYKDRVGTPEGDVPGLLSNALGPDRSFVSMNVWCETPIDVVSESKRLDPGQQLLAMPVIVIFNQALDEAGSDTRGPANETDVVMDDGRSVHVTRFDASARPPSSAIDTARDKVSGHQILIIRDAVTSEIRVYEPEITGTSDHFMELDEEGRNFEAAFRDTPASQIYGYVRIIGKITPKALPPRMFAQYMPSWL